MNARKPDPADMFPDLDAVFRALDARPTVAAYARAASQIRRLAGSLRPIRISLVASFTADPQLPYLAVESARRGFAAEIYVGPFNNVEQELLDPSSGCARQDPDVVLIERLLVDVAPRLASEFLSLDESAADALVRKVAADTAAMLAAFRRHSRAALILHNFAMPLDPSLGLFDSMADRSQTATIRSLNAALARAAGGVPATYILDFDRLIADNGYRNSFDERLWYLARSPLSSSALTRLAQAHGSILQALFGVQRKCLVVDLDNTLWGGILGEEGFAGIELGHSYPGNAYRDFQGALLELRRRGVLLAINSKNNLRDVEEVFSRHPEMILRWEDFAAARVNWREKPENMSEIAAELNIGLDSLVFFDDNPAERERMRQALPQILTLSVPPEPSGFVRTLSDSRAFERLSLTDEDLRRSEMYAEQKARRELERSAGSLDEFLSGLEMTVEVQALDDLTLPRAVELLRKTNQFNLTTRRHSAADVTAMMRNLGSAVFTVRVMDRFGDNGVVGLAIVFIRKDTALLDTLLLSCRVIGRRVETALLAFLADWARSRGVRWLDGEFIPTAKNAPASDFYPRHGFTKAAESGEISRWRLDLETVPFEWPAFIRRPDAPAVLHG